MAFYLQDDDSTREHAEGHVSSAILIVLVKLVQVLISHVSQKRGPGDSYARTDPQHRLNTCKNNGLLSKKSGFKRRRRIIYIRSRNIFNPCVAIAAI